MTTNNPQNIVALATDPLSRHTVLLNNLLDQLALEAQKLVQIVQHISKMHQLAMKTIQSENKASARLQSIRVLTNLAHSQNPDIGRSLPEQWSSMRLLCASLESTMNGIHTEIHVYVDEMSRIVEQIATGAVADLKANEFNVPFYILKLLSAVKFSVKAYVERLMRMVDVDAQNDQKDLAGAPPNKKELAEMGITVGETSTSAVVAAATAMVVKRASMALNSLPVDLDFMEGPGHTTNSCHEERGDKSKHSEIKREVAISETAPSAVLEASDQTPTINNFENPVNNQSADMEHPHKLNPAISSMNNLGKGKDRRKEHSKDEVMVEHAEGAAASPASARTPENTSPFVSPLPFRAKKPLRQINVNDAFPTPTAHQVDPPILSQTPDGTSPGLGTPVGKATGFSVQQAAKMFEQKSAAIAASASSLKKRPTVKRNAGASTPEKGPESHPAPPLPVLPSNLQEKFGGTKQPSLVNETSASKDQFQEHQQETGIVKPEPEIGIAGSIPELGEKKAENGIEASEDHVVPIVGTTEDKLSFSSNRFEQDGTQLSESNVKISSSSVHHDEIHDSDSPNSLTTEISDFTSIGAKDNKPDVSGPLVAALQVSTNLDSETHEIDKESPGPDGWKMVTNKISVLKHATKDSWYIIRELRQNEMINHDAETIGRIDTELRVDVHIGGPNEGTSQDERMERRSVEVEVVETKGTANIDHNNEVISKENTDGVMLSGSIDMEDVNKSSERLSRSFLGDDEELPNSTETIFPNKQLGFDPKQDQFQPLPLLPGLPYTRSAEVLSTEENDHRQSRIPRKLISSASLDALGVDDTVDVPFAPPVSIFTAVQTRKASSAQRRRSDGNEQDFSSAQSRKSRLLDFSSASQEQKEEYNQRTFSPHGSHTKKRSNSVSSPHSPGFKRDLNSHFNEQSSGHSRVEYFEDARQSSVKNFGRESYQPTPDNPANENAFPTSFLPNHPALSSAMKNDSQTNFESYAHRANRQSLLQILTQSEQEVLNGDNGSSKSALPDLLRRDPMSVTSNLSAIHSAPVQSHNAVGLSQSTRSFFSSPLKQNSHEYNSEDKSKEAAKISRARPPPAPQIILIPLNGMFDLCYLNLGSHNRIGRSNTENHERFKAFPSQVVSRNHMEVWEENDKVFIQDIGSQSGTYFNGARLSPAGKVSEPVQVQSGDCIQLGKDYIEEGADPNGPVEPRHRCVKAQIMIVPRSSLASPVQPLSAPTFQTHYAGLPPSTPAPAPIPPPVYQPQLHPQISKPESQTQDLPRSSEQRQIAEQRQFAEELHMLKLRLPIINSPLHDPYQQQLEAEKRQIENQIYEQHKKIERELSGSNIAPTFQTMPDDEGRSMKLQPVQNITIQQMTHRNPQNMFSLTSRLKFTVIFQTGALKAKKMQIVTTKSGMEIFNINLKQWESKRSSVAGVQEISLSPHSETLVEKTPTSSTTSVTSKNSRELYTISVNANPIATAGYISSTKLQVDLLPQQGVKPTPEQIQLGAPVFTFSGELKEDKYLVVMRYPNSRGQQYYGEALGRTFVKKNVRDKVAFNVELENNEHLQLLLGAVVYISASGGGPSS
ncbi:hypothetical protein BJ742DRAFT_771462 [Cladochytrium replicatum]|nr:hypothetical protein BJ742DRAFT_771462 [Cladochytrium replicatum]